MWLHPLASYPGNRSDGRYGSQQESNAAVTFHLFQSRNFRIPEGFNFLETHKVMSSKKFILLSCVVPCVFAVSTATAQMRGHGALMPSMQRAPTGRAPIQRAPTFNSTSRFNRFNDHDRDDRFRRRVIVFNDFGFGFPFFGSFPFSYGYPYPYPYYGYGYPYGAYGYPYGGYGSYGYGGYGSYGYGAGYGGY